MLTQVHYYMCIFLATLAAEGMAMLIGWLVGWPTILVQTELYSIYNYWMNYYSIFNRHYTQRMNSNDFCDP